MPSRAVISVVFLVVAAVILASAFYRARGLTTRPRPPDLAALVVTLTALGLSFALQAPVARELENLLVTNLGQLLGNGATLIAAFSAIALVLYILEDDPARTRVRLRPRLGALGAALAAMAVLFAANPGAAEEFASPGTALGIVVYYLIYLAYLAVALIDLLALVRRYARETPDPYLQIGMRIVALACVVGLVYVVLRPVDLTLNYLRVDFVARVPAFGLLEFLLVAVVPSTAVVLIVIGFTFRRWAPVAVRPAQWLLRHRFYRRSYRRLEPLWEAVHEVLPEIALKIRDDGARPRLRLYGRIIELNDAEYAVDPYTDARVRDEAEQSVRVASLSAGEAQTVVDTAVLAAGLQALRENRLAVPLGPPGGAPQPDVTEMDLTREAQRLERMSWAYVHSPIVRRFSSPTTEATP